MPRTITRRLNCVLDEISNLLGVYYDSGAFEAKLKKLKKAKFLSTKPTLLSELYDMLDKVGIDFVRNQEIAYYEELIKKNSNKISNVREVEEKVILKIFDYLKKYPSAEEYMHRLVNTLGDPAYADDTVRLRILKQFIKYGNCLHEAGFDESRGFFRELARTRLGIKNREYKPSIDEILESVDDKLFDALDGASKDALKRQGKFGLIKLSNDLARGHFNAQTRRSLYLFAVVFGMGFESDKRIFDEKSDIEKNLFTDYYQCFIIRKLTKTKSPNFNFKEPYGLGIDYGSAIDVIYLYFMSKNHLKPEDIIKQAENLFKCLKQDTLGRTKFTLGRQTEKEELLIEDILSKKQEELESLVKENCYFDDDDYALGRAQRQARFEQRKIIENILAIPNNELSSYNYGLWLDLDSLRTTLNSQDNYDELFSLLRNFNEYLSAPEGEIPSFLLMNDNNSENVTTRLSILSAYYYLFNALHESDAKGEWTFNRIYNEFEKNLTPIFELCSMLPINVKNITDILLVLSSYLYLNL